jgi:hypothetical protein
MAGLFFARQIGAEAELPIEPRCVSATPAPRIKVPENELQALR